MPAAIDVRPLPMLSAVPRDYQDAQFADVLQKCDDANPGDSVLYASPTGSGKCHGLGTPILMFDGMVKAVEDVRVGDTLMGPDSRPRRVLGTARGRGPLYRVTPVKGTPYVVNEEHVLSLKRTPEKKGDARRIENVPVRKYLAAANWKRHLWKGWRAVVEWPGRAVEIPPYVLGVWLGDGARDHPAITTPDPEVAAAWCEWGAGVGLTPTVKDQPGCRHYYLSTGDKRLSIPNPFTAFVRRHKLDDSKYIPHEYLVNSRANRLDLLAGLLDTDGHLSNGGFDWISVYPKLAEHVAFLARSLGFAAYVTPCRKECGNNGVWGDYYRVSISGDLSAIPTRVKRKQACPRRQIKDVLVTGLTVEPIGEGEYAGFQVDGDHLYLLGDFTVTHNSLMALRFLAWHPDAILVTPRLEIVADMLRKVGVDPSGWSDNRLAREALSYRITTPVRLRNLLAKGELPFRPTCLIIDEAHHFTADTYTEIETYLGPVFRVGLTATPFRGNPRGTEEFLSRWQELVWVLTYPQAAERGVIAVPEPTVWPLVDDDLIDVVNGEFRVSESEATVAGVFDEVAERCREFGRDRRAFDVMQGPEAVGYHHAFDRWDRPTMFSVPSVAAAGVLHDALHAAGLPSHVVTQDTPRAVRQRAFAACVSCATTLVQIDVVSEGVDLPIRRLIDLRPTMSPVKWLQQVGRIARPLKPGEEPPEYICCNRNLERHGYLYEGLLPPSAMTAAQLAFGGRPSARMGARVVGSENLTRFQAAELPLADGCTGVMYCLVTTDGYTRKEYAVILHPCSQTPLYASRENTGGKDGVVSYGKWKRADGIPDVTGFGSVPAKVLSEKQQAWWKRSAARFGLNASREVNRRAFPALPILQDLGVKISG